MTRAGTMTTTQSFVRLAILHEGERCAEECPHLQKPVVQLNRYGCRHFRMMLEDAPPTAKRCTQCVQGTTQQALDDAVLEAAEAWRDLKGAEQCRSARDAQVVNGANLGRLSDAIDARRSATREGSSG